MTPPANVPGPAGQRPAFLHPFARPAATDFLRIVRGEGAVVYDEGGKRYVDAMASLWYCNVGHGREEVANAIAEQARRLGAFQTFERYTNPPVDMLCEEIAAMAPSRGSRVFLTSSGSEAVDTAVKLARLSHAVAGAPERTLVVSRSPSYHGVTYGGTSLTGLPPNQEHFGPLVGDIVQVGKDDLEAVADLMRTDGARVAAVIAEPVIGAGGLYPPAPGYLEGLRRLCDEHGAWLILDEVICGFGRLGYWWGADRFGVRPDLQSFAKGITSGYVPLGGVVVGPVVLEALDADPDLMLRHGHTYSGHPTACAAGLAVLDIMRKEDLVARAPVIGGRLREGFEDLLARGLLAEVRGDGAMWGVGLPDGVDAAAVRDGMLERGVIVRPIGTSTVTFCPPLVTSEPDLDLCVEVLGDTLTSMRGQQPP